ncbi:hypothetical protein Btru_023588 [Bulinus truncatus]|nr:hypothetical protein Btru_023588 [Bulinus truncatus]
MSTILLTLLLTSCLCRWLTCVPCDNSLNTCAIRYVDKTRPQPVGCDNSSSLVTTVSPSRLSCAMAWSIKNTFGILTYSRETTTCAMCPGAVVTSINFTSSGKVHSWPLQNLEKSWPLTNVASQQTDRAMAIPITISSGSVVHLCGYLYSLAGFYIDFRQDPAGNTVIFHFRARRDAFTGWASVLVFSYYNNGQWAPEIKPVMTPYPFIANTVTTVDILVTTSSYKVYINETYCCSFNHVLPYANVRYIRIIGSIQVYEFSV